MLYTTPLYRRPQFLSFSPAVVVDLAVQVATKRLSGSRSDRLLVAFYASATREDVDPLDGGVTGKRVAARQLLLGEFWLGSVSMRFSDSEGLKQEEVGATVFSPLFANCEDDALRGLGLGA